MSRREVVAEMAGSTPVFELDDFSEFLASVDQKHGIVRGGRTLTPTHTLSIDRPLVGKPKVDRPDVDSEPQRSGPRL